MSDPALSIEANAPPAREDSYLVEVDRILEFFATQVKLNASMNAENYDADFHEKAKRRAVRSLLAAMSYLESGAPD